MAPIQQKRKTDFTSRWDTVIKGIISFVIISILAFLGNWVIGVGSSVAKLNERMIGIEEKENFLSTWLVDAVKEMKIDIKQIALEQKQLNEQVQHIANEQARRKSIIERIDRENNRK
jgi:hypothetical protein